MGVLTGCALPLCLALGAPPAPAAVGPGRPQPGGFLAAEDARYLDHLVDDFLFDPRHATYVRIPAPGSQRRLRFQYGRPTFLDERDTREGWLVRGTAGKPDRIYFADRGSIPVPPTRVQELDFESICAGRPVDNQPLVDHDLRVLLSDYFDFGEDTDLVRAAWLHRRGYDGLAARYMAAARAQSDDPLAITRRILARRAFDALVVGFQTRADAAALGHGERLLQLYPDLVDKYPQAEAIVADLKRRRAAGSFGKVPATGWPAGFATWPVDKKVAFLVDSLDDVAEWHDNPRAYRSRGVTDDDDRRVKALVELGDAAVPALIEAIEKDGRLTRQSDEHARSRQRFRDDSPTTFTVVRTVAEGVVRAILQVGHFDPTGPERPDDSSPKATADRLRRYWAAYGRLPFPDRMMAILTNTAAHPPARREAACSLVSAYGPPATSWARSDHQPGGGSVRPSPLVAKYRGPSVAEAILAAMDQELAGQDRDEDRAGRRHRTLNNYLNALAELGDQRVGPELARRAGAAEEIETRIRFAQAALTLGTAGPMVRLAREMAAGTVRLPPVPHGDDARSVESAEVDVAELVHALAGCPLPEADEALYALADGGHPTYPLVERAIVNDSGFMQHGGVWKRHPFCLTVLRRALTDTRPTGEHYYLRGNEIEERAGRRQMRRQLPDSHADPALWFEHVDSTVADEAADRLSALVIGMPEYHALRRDAGSVRAEMRSFLDRYPRRLRRMTVEEYQAWRMPRWDATYIPDIPPLGRPATAADVKAGRAVFELKGEGKLADRKLPCWLTLKEGAGADDQAAGLVVQAEVGRDGKVVYGVIFRHSIRAVRAIEVGRVESFDREQQRRRRGSFESQLPQIIWER